ncbi:hypothetical protein AB205_0074780, partial [Aquarana catesbeiana]
STTGRQLQYLVTVLCPLHSVHLKLPEDNWWCSSDPISTTGRQLQYLQLVHCVLCTVHLKLPEDNCCCSAPINTTGRQLQYLQKANKECLEATVLVLETLHPHQHMAMGHACPFFWQLAVLSRNMRKT